MTTETTTNHRQRKNSFFVCVQTQSTDVYAQARTKHDSRFSHIDRIRNVVFLSFLKPKRDIWVNAVNAFAGKILQSIMVKLRTYTSSLCFRSRSNSRKIRPHGCNSSISYVECIFMLQGTGMNFSLLVVHLSLVRMIGPETNPFST